jgi:hypothetical protein
MFHFNNFFMGTPVILQRCAFSSTATESCQTISRLVSKRSYRLPPKLKCRSFEQLPTVYGRPFVMRSIFAISRHTTRTRSTAKSLPKLCAKRPRWSLATRNSACTKISKSSGNSLGLVSSDAIGALPLECARARLRFQYRPENPAYRLTPFII